MSHNCLNVSVYVLIYLAALFPVPPLFAAEPTSLDRSAAILSASSLSNVVREIAEKASPGVVTVYALRGPRMTIPMRIREEIKQQQMLEETNHRHASSTRLISPDDQGSGFIIDRQGYVLTCSHVVENANTVFVRTADGRKFYATEVVCDPISDLAIIKLKGAENLEEVQLGDSDHVVAGDWVISLASPYDLQRSVSAGIVSSTRRWVSNSPHPMIQNDAATNPGSSGGALLNLRGEVVGIIIGGFSSTGKFQGIALATPINTAKEIAEQLKTKGYVQRGYFGFNTQSLTPEMATVLKSSIDNGLYVTDVQMNSPSSRAGLLEGDVITEFDGEPVDQSFDPQSLTADSTPRKKHFISLVRDHKAIQLELEMGQPRSPRATTALADVPPTESFEYFDSLHGLGLSHLEASMIRELELPEDAHGALVTYVAFKSDAYREGVAAGMVIARINERPIMNLSEYQAVSSKLEPDKPLLLLLQSNQGKHLVMLPMNHRANDE